MGPLHYSIKHLPVSGGSNRFTENADFHKYIFSSKAKMTTLGSYQKPKNRCGSRLFRFSHRLKPNEKYRLGSKTPKIADLRQKIGDFYFFTITYSLFTKSNQRFWKVISNSEYVHSANGEISLKFRLIWITMTVIIR